MFNAPSLFWSLGGDALQPILQGGRNRAHLAAAQAAYDEAVANYRQTVLTAFQQVEDGISNLSTLSQALSTQSAAVEDARKALEIANNRYVGGVTNYLDVITAQTTLLSNQRLETQLLGQRLVNTVYLVKALAAAGTLRRSKTTGVIRTRDRSFSNNFLPIYPISFAGSCMAWATSLRNLAARAPSATR